MAASIQTITGDFMQRKSAATATKERPCACAYLSACVRMLDTECDEHDPSLEAALQEIVPVTTRCDTSRVPDPTLPTELEPRPPDPASSRTLA